MIKIKACEKPHVEIIRLGHEFKLMAIIHGPQNGISYEQANWITKKFGVRVHIKEEVTAKITIIIRNSEKISEGINKLDKAVKQAIAFLRENNKMYRQIKNEIKNHKNFE